MRPPRNPLLIGLFLLLGLLWIPPMHGGADDNTGYITVDSAAPQWTYTGTANNSQVEWELDGAFTARWTVNDASPDEYFIYWNQTGSNTTRASGSYTDGQSVSSSYDPGLPDVGNTIYFQLWLNDSFAHANASLVYFSVVNTNPPTVSVESPTNTTYTGTVTVTLASESQDADTFWYAVFYTDDTPHTENTTWSESVELSLESGSYYLVGYVNDTAALEDSSTVYFTVDLDPGEESDGKGGGKVKPRQTTAPSSLWDLFSWDLDSFFDVLKLFVVALVIYWLLDFFRTRK